MEHSLVEAFPAPCLLIGQNERIVRSNVPARALFGNTIDNRNYITVLRQPQLLTCVESVLRQRKTATTPFMTSEARRDVDWHVTATPVQIAGAFHVLVVLEDRTAMREAGQMRRDFVANVSHELRTPLTALIGFIETLKGAARNDPAAQAKFLDIMEREASRMTRLVKDLLSLSKVEAEQRMRPTQVANLRDVVEMALTTLRPAAADAGVEVVLSPKDPKESHGVAGDSDQLSQVVTNLIENAVKYSGRGSSVQVTIESIPRDPILREQAVLLSVADDGEGIDEIHIPRLTERFYRVDAHRSRELGGTGLGLAIVKHIVNRHRGRLDIQSAPGQGSTFRVILPVAAE